MMVCHPDYAQVWHNGEAPKEAMFGFRGKACVLCTAEFLTVLVRPIQLFFYLNPRIQVLMN